MRVRNLNRSLVALAVGLAALSAHAGPADPQKQLIRTTVVDVFGTKITLAKYLYNGQVCQQYVKEAGTVTGFNRLTWDVKLDEICDKPELRTVDGEQELFPAKVLTVDNAANAGAKLGIPMIGIGRVEYAPPPQR